MKAYGWTPSLSNHAQNPKDATVTEEGKLQLREDPTQSREVGGK